MIKKLNLLWLSFFLSTEAVSMPIGEKLYLMSEISGTITLNGEPAAGAKLKRIVSKAYSRSELTDEAVADANGYFSMPAVTQRKFVQKLLPLEFVVPSLIFVTYQGQEYKIWSSTKRDPENNTENRGKPLVVQCELVSEIQRFRVDGAPFTVLCDWGIEADNSYVVDAPVPDSEI